MALVVATHGVVVREIRMEHRAAEVKVVQASPAGSRP